MEFKISETESKGIGYKIARSKITEIISDEILRELYKSSVDIGILRIPTKEQKNIYKLNELGVDYILADTLVEYSIKPAKLKNVSFDHSLEYVNVKSKEDLNVINKMVDELFADYSNHYSSNNFIDSSKLVDWYKEWIADCVHKKGVAYLIKKNQVNAGFFSGTIEDRKFHGGPGGVLNRFSGEGIYLDMHKKLPFLLQENGADICYTSTQIQNHAVQKQWSLVGWTLSESWITVHVNSFFDSALNTNPEKINLEKNATVQELINKVSNHKNIKSFRQLSVKILEEGRLKECLTRGEELVINYSTAIKSGMSSDFYVILIRDSGNKLLGIMQIRN